MKRIYVINALIFCLAFGGEALFAMKGFPQKRDIQPKGRIDTFVSYLRGESEIEKAIRLKDEKKEPSQPGRLERAQGWTKENVPYGAQILDATGKTLTVGKEMVVEGGKKAIEFGGKVKQTFQEAHQYAQEAGAYNLIGEGYGVARRGGRQELSDWWSSDTTQHKFRKIKDPLVMEVVKYIIPKVIKNIKNEKMSEVRYQLGKLKRNFLKFGKEVDKQFITFENTMKDASSKTKKRVSDFLANIKQLMESQSLIWLNNYTSLLDNEWDDLSDDEFKNKLTDLIYVIPTSEQLSQLDHKNRILLESNNDQIVAIIKSGFMRGGQILEKSSDVFTSLLILGLFDQSFIDNVLNFAVDNQLVSLGLEIYLNGLIMHKDVGLVEIAFDILGRLLLQVDQEKHAEIMSYLRYIDIDIQQKNFEDRDIAKFLDLLVSLIEDSLSDSRYYIRASAKELFHKALVINTMIPEKYQEAMRDRISSIEGVITE